MNKWRLHLKYNWKPRGLARAKSLVGRDWTDREEEVIQAYESHGEERHMAVFLAYGIRPETKGYIQSTIDMLEQEEESYAGQLNIAKIRLQWSCEILIGGLPA